MLRIISCISIAILLFATACKKGDPIEEQAFGFVKLELLQLPGTPNLEVYVENTKLSEQLVAGPAVYAPQLLEAGKPTKISFRKAGTATSVMDTTLTLEEGQRLDLRLAYSEDLSLKSFMKSQSTVSMDSIAFQLFNKIPEVIQPAGMHVDAVLCRLDNMTGEFVDVTTYENFALLKLHPKSMTLPVRDADGMDIVYFIRLKNVETGEFLMDAGFNDINAFGGLEPGKEHILTITTFVVDFGSGPMHYFTMEPIIL